MRNIAATLAITAAALLLPKIGLAQEIPNTPTGLGGTPTTPNSVPINSAKPTIIVGSPLISPNPNAFSAINSNQPDSPLAGVVSVYGALSASDGVRGSGVALDPYHILTAAHVVDFLGGTNGLGQVSGDGVVDALIPYSRIFVNSISVPEPLFIQSINLHPDWHGFGNLSAPDPGSIHDDLAIITLRDPLPSTVPTYQIYQTPFHQDFGKILLMTGYGGGGDEVNGVTQPATVEIKRFGWNLTATYETDDEITPGIRSETYLADFDRPDALGNPDPFVTGIDGYTSLGNDFEATIAPGDSGGPAFLVDDRNNNGLVEADELIVFGLTTFTFDTFDGNWPRYGSAFGGPILSAYTDFIGTYVSINIPEPTTLTLLLAGTTLLLKRKRRPIQ